MSKNTQSTSKSRKLKNDLSPDRFVGLEEMRRLNDEISEMIRKFKQKEALNSLNTTLNEEGETSMREQPLNQQRVDVASNSNEPISQTDIRRRIYGKWRNVDDHNDYFSAKFEGYTFIIKRDFHGNYREYQLGVKHWDGSTMTVENNKVVMRKFTKQGEERRRFEFKIENGRLQYTDYVQGEERSKITFEKYANPDPEY